MIVRMLSLLWLLCDSFTNETGVGLSVLPLCCGSLVLWNEYMLALLCAEDGWTRRPPFWGATTFQTEFRSNEAAINKLFSLEENTVKLTSCGVVKTRSYFSTVPFPTRRWRSEQSIWGLWMPILVDWSLSCPSIQLFLLTNVSVPYCMSSAMYRKPLARCTMMLKLVLLTVAW